MPYKTISCEYALEYGTAKVEMHIDSLKKGWNVLIHDDLLATGGTAEAAAQLVKQQGANVCGKHQRVVFRPWAHSDDELK